MLELAIALWALITLVGMTTAALKWVRLPKWMRRRRRHRAWINGG